MMKFYEGQSDEAIIYNFVEFVEMYKELSYEKVRPLIKDD